MKKFVLLAILICTTGAFAVTYKGSYYQEGWISVSNPNMPEVNISSPPYYIDHWLKITNLSVVLYPGTFQSCTTPPQAKIVTLYNGTIVASIPNGVSSVNVPLSTEIDPGSTDQINLKFAGGVGCTTSTGIHNEAMVVAQYQLETGAFDIYYANSWWKTTAPATGLPFLRAEFDNPLPRSVGFSLSTATLFTGWSLQNCSPLATTTYKSGATYDTTQDFPNLIIWIQQGIGGLTPSQTNIVHSNVMGVGCNNPTPTEYADTGRYSTVGGDLGPYWMSAFYDSLNPQNGPFTIVIFPAAQTGETIRTLRASVNGGEYPKNCTTYPSVQVKVGAATNTASFTSAQTDPLWTGTMAVPSGSTVRFVYNQGVGCDVSEVQFTVIASYSTP